MPIDEAERRRRRALIHAHYEAENRCDLDRIMATFAPEGEMLYNRLPFRDDESIRQAHTYIGFAGQGAFSGIHNVRDGEHFTVEGYKYVWDRIRRESALAATVRLDACELQRAEAVQRGRKSPDCAATLATSK